MAYNYSNPFTQQATSSEASTPTAPTSYTVLFGGLPKDTREYSLKELFAAPLPHGLNLHPTASTIQILFDPNAQSLGLALITVASESIAESIRSKFSGQVLDGVDLTVQHILSREIALPLPKPAPPITRIIQARPLTPLPTPTPTQPRYPITQPRQPAKAQNSAQQKAAGSGNPTNGKPPGLALLSRLGKPGAGKVTPVTPINLKGMTPREKQIALMAAQKQSQAPGQALLQRLARPSNLRTPSNSSKLTPNTRKVRPTPNNTSGTAKVGRAKESAAKSMKMEIDEDVVVAPQGQGGRKGREEKVGKTQAELDEEMRAYERARRFGASA